MSVRNPLVGFNDNIEHRGHTYHIQTEDSAGRRCNVITHLFADGGRIVTSSKSSYKDYAEEPNVDERVRELMREQHLAMQLALQAGTYDAMLGVVPGPAAPVAPPAAPLSRDPTPRAPLAALPDPPALAGHPVVHQPLARPATSPEVLAQTPPHPGGSAADRATQAPAVTDRRPTPATGGAYRFVGNGSEQSTPDADPSTAPPRKRRYPQTNPGRVRPSSHSMAAAHARGTAFPPGFPSNEPFGSQTPMTRRLDELIVELIAELRSS